MTAEDTPKRALLRVLNRLGWDEDNGPGLYTAESVENYIIARRDEIVAETVLETLLLVLDSMQFDGKYVADRHRDGTHRLGTHTALQEILGVIDNLDESRHSLGHNFTKDVAPRVDALLYRLRNPSSQGHQVSTAIDDSLSLIHLQATEHADHVRLGIDDATMNAAYDEAAAILGPEKLQRAAEVVTYYHEHPSHEHPYKAPTDTDPKP